MTHKTILLIDDDVDEQFFFIEALQKINAPVKFFFANGAKEGLTLVKFLSPDFIFIDFNMPQTNGLECLENIMHNGKHDYTKIIMYSTGLTDSMCEMALQKGASKCIKKQSSIHDLINALEAFLKDELL